MTATMKRQLGNCLFRVMCLVSLLAFVSVLAAEPRKTSEPGTARISERKIASLQQGVAQQKKLTSSINRRRACKSTVRKAEALLDAFPTAPNRFRVLAIMLDSQKRLLSLENSDRNRDAMFETCGKLAKAPNEYADLRLEADLLLSERAMTLKNADVKERAHALEDLLKRYRDTSGEAKSLMMASLIAPKLNAFDLEKQIYQAMDDRFAGDLDVIAWRRSHHDFGHFRVLFTGTFKRADGTWLTFPIDGMGHTCLMYFWSKHTRDIKQRLAEVKALQTRFPEQFEVFSLNLDELPDAGEKTLRALGLDWTALYLPGGRKSRVYRVYVGRGSVGVRVNAHGHALLPSNTVRTLVEEMPMEQNFDDVRYLSQLQSLLVGEFLVAGTNSEIAPHCPAESVPAETLDAIQACFVAVPLRYRLTRAEALANYERAEKLCRDTITKYAKAPDLWLVRNRRIIALLGMWNLACEPKHLEEAARESRIALRAVLPNRADAVPRFCLAKEALRKGDSDPKSVLDALVKETGGLDAPASTYAAAAILAMDVNAKALHAQYRAMLLESHNGDPAMWPVVSFLRDQNHTFRLFKANYYMPPSRARRTVRAALRRNAAALDVAPDNSGPMKAEFKTLAGDTLNLPEATDGKLTLLMFVEPPEDVDANFPTVINGSITEGARGRKIEIRGAMQDAFELADLHVHKNLKVIAAFLCDDADRVEALMKKCNWPCQALMVPGGLGNPLVRRLGILNADRVPNIFLLGDDGTIAWKLSGIVHPQLKCEGVGELGHVIHLAMKSNIELYEMEAAVRALGRGKYQQALRLFSGPFPPPRKSNPDGWTAPRLHGRALAHMGARNLDAALADIDEAIDTHLKRYSHSKDLCDATAEMRLVRATILEQLGRKEEAQAERKGATAPIIGDSTTRYGAFHDKLKKFRLAQHSGK